MSLLEKLGLAQKKNEGAPNIGKKKIEEQKKIQLKRNRIYRGLIFGGFLLIVIGMLPESTFQPVASYAVGEPWRADDLTAPFTFSLNKTEAELEREREAIRENTAPIFHLNHNARISIESNLDSLFRSIQPVIDNFLQWQQAKEEELESAPNDSIRYFDERNYAAAQLDDDAWKTLTNNYLIRYRDDTQRPAVVNEIRNELNSLLNELLNDGIIDRRKDEMETEEITIRNLRQRTERTINIANTRDLPEVREYAQYHLNREFMPDVASVAFQLFNQVIQPNWNFSESDTQRLLEENLANISRTKGAVAQGQVIIRRGDIVTPEKANMLRSLAQARATTASETERWLRFSGDVIIIVVTALVFLFYLFLYRRSIFNNPAMFLLVFLTLLLVCVASALVYSFDNVTSFIVPIAVAPIILTIIFDSRVGLMATVTLAIITALIHDNSFDYVVATITACSLGIFSVRDIKKRSQFFFTTPGIVFITYLLIIGGFALARFSGWEKFLDDTMFVAINSVFILFTYPLILLFEKSFKITTDFTLLELSDTNLPLLKELMTKAPGSFHHSLQVANLAEAAASAIGANALLCRVGALYHDIGKMVKPSYFIENQTEGNEHDKLKAKMSALVIKAHVSDGVKIARKHDLPEVIIDFIKTHHGTSLIRFFYDKAQKNPEKEAEIPEDDFRYDGPVPFTKEQGILLLADGVEAASRSMKDPTYSKLEALITRMVDDNISEGQLSNCPLTFRQIQIIKESFLSILVGVYHSRIEYPEDKKTTPKKLPAKTSETDTAATDGNTPDSGQDNSGEVTQEQDQADLNR